MDQSCRTRGHRACAWALGDTGNELHMLPVRESACVCFLLAKNGISATPQALPEGPL
jgi:hypothetical protein